MGVMNVDGLTSGLDTTSIINQLMQIERQPQTRLRAKVTADEKMVSIYQAINTKLASLQDAALKLSTMTSWALRKTSSSDATAATATATATARPGSLSFTVDRVASTHSLITLGSVSSTATVVTTPGSNLFLAAAGAIGFSALTSSADLAAGDHTVAVTTASAGASVSGTALASTVTVTAGQQLAVGLDATGLTTQTFDLTAGTYTRQDLADMVTAASGGLLKATVSSTGALELSTVREGSAARLTVTAANSTLGFAAPTATAAGSDGVVTVDGVATTVTDTDLTTVLSAGTGSLSASFSGGLRLGTVTGKNVSVGDGTLGAVVSAINAADAGMKANALQASPGQYKLQVTSTTSGAAGALSLGTGPFTAGTLGIFDTLAAASDAQLTLGTGARVTSTSNTFSEVVPGLTLSALKASGSPVTVTVDEDSATLADNVQKLVDGVNGVLGYLTEQGAYNAASKTAGPLLADSAARSVEAQLRKAVSTLTSGTSLADAGISIQRDGTLKFDRDAFLTKYEADPDAMAALFHDGGTSGVADDGLAKRLQAMAKAATDSVTGITTTAINGRKSEIKSLQTQIDNWDVRLARREAMLRRQFSGLEVALGKLKSQSSWLAGQINSLPTSGS